MLARFGRIAGRRPHLVIAAWVVVTALLVVTSPDAADLARQEPQSLLPAAAPYSQALDWEREAFPNVAARTRTVLVFESDGPLSPTHEQFLSVLSWRLIREEAPRWGWTVHSPFAQPYLRGRLLSADGSAALLVVNSDANYLTQKSADMVARLEILARKDLPGDLRCEITGDGGLGRDLGLAVRQAFHRTTKVTLLALVVILVVVYRAPLAALVPLISIGVCVVAAIMALNHLTRWGWAVSPLEKTLVVVLLFGSGTDFALFWLAAYRRGRADAGDSGAAAEHTSRQTGPAIVASAATTIIGLAMLMTADLRPSINAGRSLVVALLFALVCALTLVPALAVVMGQALYWPLRAAHGGSVEGSTFWHRVADRLVRRPGVALLIVGLLLAWPAWHGLQVRYTYDALGIMPPGSSAARGQEIVERRFSAEQLFGWSCLVTLSTDLDQATAAARSAEIAAEISGVRGVSDVWSLDRPLGTRSALASADSPVAELFRRQASEFYFARQHRALRFEVMLSSEPFSLAAMDLCTAVMQRVGQWAQAHLPPGSTVQATGMTPYILGIRAAADRDCALVMPLVVGVVFVVVIVLVRHLRLAGLMVAATLVGYFVTVGITEWFFVTVAGEGGIDWKVKLFVFVILVAVGQDYNIFLVSRLLAERRRVGDRAAVRQAVAATGSVISSCGVIMAATLGSLAATGLVFFQELGFAFACGVLLDTFVVRPVLLPAAYLVTGRWTADDPPPEAV